MKSPPELITTLTHIMNLTVTPYLFLFSKRFAWDKLERVNRPSKGQE